MGMLRPTVLFSIVFTIAWMAYLPACADEVNQEQLEFFERKVRPVLVENCLKCHSGETRQRANLLLDSRELILKGGDTGPAIVPGDPEKSLLVKAIRYENPDLRMPPTGKLSAEQIENLTRWVKMGAPWPKTDAAAKKINSNKGIDLAERAKHWAFQPMKRPVLPEVRDCDWPLSPIDFFILHKLEEIGLKPSPPADKRTLLRRVYFDLIGLPPTPQQIHAFLEDHSPDAFAKVVEQLLASPHYGERWGRHWLDLVRYAETAGHEFDMDLPDAYRYRDYVIRAFNADVPYDQFVIEHLAGDLLPHPRRHPVERFNESIIGTGFWFLGESKHSPVDIKGDQAERIDNQIDVYGKTFLGLTLACARCHDHKFDPITQRDYYAAAGYLQSSRYQRAFIDDPAPLRAEIAKLTQLRKDVAALAVERTAATLQERIQALRQWTMDPNRAEFAQWKAELRKHARGAMHPLRIWLDLSAGSDVAAVRNKLFSATARKVDSARYEVFEDFSNGYDDWFVSGEAFGQSPSQAGDVLVQAEVSQPVKAVAVTTMAHSGLISPRLQGALRSRTFILEKDFIHFRTCGKDTVVRLIVDGFQKIRAPIYGGLEFAVNHGEELRWHVMDVGMWRRHRAYIEVLDDGDGYAGIDQIVFTNESSPPAVSENKVIADLLADGRIKSMEQARAAYLQMLEEILEQWRTGKLFTMPNRTDRLEILNGLLTSPVLLSGRFVPANNERNARLEQVLTAIRQVEAALPVPTRAMAMADGTPLDERLYIRGNHKNLGETVPRRYLEVYVGADAGPGTESRSGRLELARQLVEPENPLTARVMVNRIWKHHFGEGLVRSVDNFGVLGEAPTHPELLDWLATEFVRRGWSIKEMHRLMVLSRTYQMSSNSRPDAALKDAANKYMHRMPVRRLEGEIIRDSLLLLSGRLDTKMFGPSVLPHLTPFMLGRGRPDRSGPLDGDGRRSIYINVRRNFLTPMFMVFDYPVPFSTIGRRSISNVPAQALTMMNNPFIIQQSKLWADNLLKEQGLSDEQRLERLFESALGRLSSAEEKQQMMAFLREQTLQYTNNERQRAWHDLCHVIVNLKEFIYVN